MNGLLQDLRYALRQLRKSPGFFSVVVLTLGLGIGANTAIFSMVDWLVLRSLPIKDPQQMHFLSFTRPGANSEIQFSYPEFADIQKQTTDVFSGITPFIFGGLAGEQSSQSGLTADGTTKAVQTAYVGGDFFSLLGITPAAGRFILNTEGKAAGADPVVVLSYSYWQTRFAGDPAIVGKAVSINGHPVTVVGVAPKAFFGPTPILEIQAYLPLSMFLIERGVDGDFLTNPSARSMLALARVKPGANSKLIQSELAVVGQRLLKQYPRDRGIGDLQANPLRPPGIMSGAANPFPKLAALFLTLAGLVLVLACINVANLFLVRAAARQREMAVRAALGAGSGRLVRQLLTESLLVAALSCGVGTLIGLSGARLLGSLPLQTELPVALDFEFNWRVFAYALAVAAATAAFVVVVPAARIRHGNLREVLHEGGRTSTGGRQRLRDVLVAVQVGGSLTLLIVAGLFVRSLRGVQTSDLGFDPQHVLNLTLDPNEIGYTEQQGRAFYRAMLERARALPGVQSASLASVVPLSDSVQGSDLVIPGYATSANQEAPHAEDDVVSSDYFRTMRIALQRGRDFTDADNESAPHVAVINQSMAERFWPRQDPLGKSFTLTSDPKHPATIVGVVRKQPNEPTLRGIRTDLLSAGGAELRVDRDAADSLGTKCAGHGRRSKDNRTVTGPGDSRLWHTHDDGSPARREWLVVLRSRGEPGGGVGVARASSRSRWCLRSDVLFRQPTHPRDWCSHGAGGSASRHSQDDRTAGRGDCRVGPDRWLACCARRGTSGQRFSGGDWTDGPPHLRGGFPVAGDRCVRGHLYPYASGGQDRSHGRSALRVRRLR